MLYPGHPSNITLIAELRDQIAQILEPTSLLLTKVLYSGTHGGDTIPLEQVGQLECELLKLHEVADRSGTQCIREFINTMNELVAAAKAERNPIVF